MKNDVNLAEQFKNYLQKDSRAFLNTEQANTGLETLAKFFELLWEFDLADKRKEKEMDIKNHVT